MGEPKLGYNAPVSREEEANEDFTFKSAVYKHTGTLTPLVRLGKGTI